MKSAKISIGKIFQSTIIIPPIKREEIIFNSTENKIIITANGMVSVWFNIPLVYSYTVNHVGIINITDKQGYTSNFKNEKYYYDLCIILNVENSSFFIPTLLYTSTISE